MKKGILILILISISIIAKAQKKWTLEDCIKHAINENISIKQSKSDLEISKKNKRIAIGNFLPAINLGGSHNWNIGLNQNITTGLLENLTTQSTSLNANMSINLFNGLQNIQQLYKANLSILASQYQLEDMKDDISLLIANSYLQILFNKESLTVQKSHLKIAKEELLVTKERFTTGVIPKGDVLEIEANVATMEQNVVISLEMLQEIGLANLLH